MKGLAFLVFLIIVFVLIYKGFLSLEPLVLGSMKYYQFIIGGFLAFLLLVNPDVIKKMYTGKKRELKKEDLVEEYNFVNHQEINDNEAKNQKFINEKIKFILGGQGGKCNNCMQVLVFFKAS